MKLYYSPGACSLAAHIVANEAGLKVQLVKVDLKAHKTENEQDYFRINPKGYVPALQLDDGSLLTENVAVLNYLTGAAGEKLYTPPHDSMARHRLIEWLAYISSELHKPFGALFRGVGVAEKRKAKETIAKRLAYVEDRMREGEFLMGPKMSVADAYLFVILNWCRKMDVPLDRFPKLAALFARMSERDSVKRALREESLSLAA